MFVHRETPALQKLTGRRKPQKNYIFQGETEEKATASYAEPAGRDERGLETGIYPPSPGCEFQLHNSEDTFPWVVPLILVLL